MSDYTPDNYDAFERREREIASEEQHLPVCCLCGEHIWQDTAVRIGNDWYCDECLDDAREGID